MTTKPETTTDEPSKTIELTLEPTWYTDESFPSKRKFVDNMFDSSIDIFSKTTRTETKVDVQLDIDGLGIPLEPEYSSQEEEIAEMVEDGVFDPDNYDWIEIDVSRVEDTSFDHRIRDPAKEVLSNELDRIDFSDIGFEQPDFSVYPRSWEREVPVSDPNAPKDATETQNIRVNVNSSDIIRRRLLRRQEERVQGDRFVDDEKYWSIRTTIHIEALNKKELKTIQDKLASAYKRVFDASNLVEQRMTTCERTETAQGACYEL